MKGTLYKLKSNWEVWYAKPRTDNQNGHYLDCLPLHPDNAAGLFIQDTDGKYEGMEIEFEVVELENHVRFAKLIPFILDDFQIGPDGAYEHTDDESTIVFTGEANYNRSAYIKLEGNKVIFDCSDEEYGPIVFDIELLKDALNKHSVIGRDSHKF